jgi:Sulfotransferase domain
MTYFDRYQPTRSRRDGEPLLMRRARRSFKRIVRTLAPTPTSQRRSLLVFGCQRSGTTMLQQSLLDRSRQVIVLGEKDPKLVLPADPERLRWKPPAEVSAALARLPFELVVTKPLVESHRAAELLDSLPNSSAIWMFRHYLAVASSNLAKFGTANGHNDLEKLLSGGSGEWRAQCNDEVRDQIQSLVSKGVSDFDAAALFWWARNQLYFDQQLWQDSRVRLLRYESVVHNPAGCLAGLNDFLGLSIPVEAAGRAIRQSATPRAQLQPTVEELCAELFDRFHNVPGLAPLGTKLRRLAPPNR